MCMHLFFQISCRNDCRHNKDGFTLVELSIVLVIIGLIIGSVLVGRDLIRSAEIRSQIKQIDEFKMAVNVFKTKYNYLPGDMPPSLASQLGFFTFTGSKVGVSDGFVPFISAYGNNDGIINSYGESYPFWSHMGDAGLIKGRYSGVAGSLLIANTDAPSISAGNPTSACAIGICRPIIKVSKNVEITLVGNVFFAPFYGIIAFSNTQKQNMFWFESKVYIAYSMDIKVDDGFPASGDVRDVGTSNYTGGIVGYSPCTTSGSTVAITYDLSSSTIDTGSCYPSFLF